MHIFCSFCLLYPTLLLLSQLGGDFFQNLDLQKYFPADEARHQLFFSHLFLFWLCLKNTQKIQVDRCSLTAFVKWSLLWDHELYTGVRTEPDLRVTADGLQTGPAACQGAELWLGCQQDSGKMVQKRGARQACGSAAMVWYEILQPYRWQRGRRNILVLVKLEEMRGRCFPLQNMTSSGACA